MEAFGTLLRSGNRAHAESVADEKESCADATGGRHEDSSGGQREAKGQRRAPTLSAIHDRAHSDFSHQFGRFGEAKSRGPVTKRAGSRIYFHRLSAGRPLQLREPARCKRSIYARHIWERAAASRLRSHERATSTAFFRAQFFGGQPMSVRTGLTRSGPFPSAGTEE